MALEFLKQLFGSEKKASLVKSTFEVLGADMHSHLIPGVDDGSKDMANSIFLIRFFHELGFRKLITSPHVMQGAYDNTYDDLKAKAVEVQKELNTQHISIEFDTAAEYYFDDYFVKLVDSNAPLLTFGSKNYVLFELPASRKPAQLKETLFKLNLAGYNPVLAHPERYLYYHDKDMHQYLDLKEYNVLLQANILSFCGYYGKNIKLMVEQLANDGHIDMVGSDVHHENHCAELPVALQTNSFQRLLSSGKLLNKTL